MTRAVDQYLLDCAQAALDVPLPRYMDWAFEHLRTLIRFDSAGWGIGTHSPPVTHAIHLRGVPPAMLIAYENGIVELDYIRAAAAADPGVTINDFDIRDAFPQAAETIDTQISVPFAIEQTLATSLPDPGASGLHHFLLLWREKRFDPFNEADRLLKQRCVPHMVAGYRTAQRLHLAASAAPAEAGHALADGKGVLHSFDGRFVRLLRNQWPGWGGNQLPAPMLRVLSASAATVPGLELEITPSGALLALSITPRREDPLTLAQRRVADLYAEGLTHREIATRLGLAPATVRNQVSSVFARLQVGNKLELAERLKRL